MFRLGLPYDSDLKQLSLYPGPNVSKSDHLICDSCAACKSVKSYLTPY